MAAFLEWTEPLAVRQWRWQIEELPEIKKLFRLFGKWMLLLGVPTLLVLYHFAPLELPPTAIILLCLAVLQPLGIAGQVWANRRQCVQYSIGEKGFRRRASSGTVLYRWQTVESCRIIKHPHISGVSVLELKIKHSRKIHSWSFNPAQLDEQDLTQAVQRYLPLSRFEPL